MKISSVSGVKNYAPNYQNQNVVSFQRKPQKKQEQSFEDKEKIKLQSKLSLICEQLDVMEKAQKDAAEIQDKIVALDGDKDGKEEE